MVNLLVRASIVLLAGAIITNSSDSPRNVRKRETKYCILPPYPDHGTYTVAGDPNASPGEDPENAFLNITCNAGYSLSGKNLVYCTNGIWSTAMPKCMRFCKLSKHPSVEYHCLLTAQSVEGTRQCQEYEPLGTLVKPECKENYRHIGVLPFMRCIDGYWDNRPVCSPDCGVFKEEEIPRTAGPVSFPWHAVLYKKQNGTYIPICAGSIISSTIIISAAHCFLNGLAQGVKPSDYAIAVGKTHKSWEEEEKYEQKFDVSDIKISPQYHGESNNFQDDIALLLLSAPMSYSAHVRPVCLDFDYQFDSRQLQENGMGKITVWDNALVENASLTIIRMQYLTNEQCLARSPTEFKEYITSDKICAEYNTNTTLRVGNSGSGLVFPEQERGVTRYYLRGVVSVAPNYKDDKCHNNSSFTAFTHIIQHEHFIKEYFL